MTHDQVSRRCDGIRERVISRRGEREQYRTFTQGIIDRGNANGGNNQLGSGTTKQSAHFAKAPGTGHEDSLANGKSAHGRT
jgi:hypothetical protein